MSNISAYVVKEEKEIRTINQRHRPPQRRITRIKAKIYETQSKHRTTDNWSEKLWNWCSRHYDDNKQAPHHIPTLKTTTYRHHQHYQLTKTQHIDISVSNCECRKKFHMWFLCQCLKYSFYMYQSSSQFQIALQIYIVVSFLQSDKMLTTSKSTFWTTKLPLIH